MLKNELLDLRYLLKKSQNSDKYLTQTQLLVECLLTRFSQDSK
jgi:hypothetical protein